jgi:AcrR family transcriptional regulator
MSAKRKHVSVRKPRSDAQRNRERILEVAKEAFTRSGVNASLDDIAKAAGVGPGTLYRHFPTRETLLGAVYRTEMEKLAAAERKFAEELPPVEALRAWLLLFVDYIAAKQLIGPALNALLGDPTGSRAPEGSWTSSSPVPAQTNRRDALYACLLSRFPRGNEGPKVFRARE